MLSSFCSTAAARGRSSKTAAATNPATVTRTLTATSATSDTANALTGIQNKVADALVPSPVTDPLLTNTCPATLSCHFPFPRPTSERTMTSSW